MENVDILPGTMGLNEAPEQHTSTVPVCMNKEQAE